jgi:hypothetical protein
MNIQIRDLQGMSTINKLGRPKIDLANNKIIIEN